MKLRALFAVTIWLPLLMLSVQGAWGMTEEELDQRVREISGIFRCPTCQAVSVNDSLASFSLQIQGKIRKMILDGQGEEQIKDYFVERYGEWILRAPKKEGLGLVLWILPGLAILVVGVWIGIKTRQSARAYQEELTETNQESLTEEQRNRIAKDLKRYEEV